MGGESSLLEEGDVLACPKCHNDLRDTGELTLVDWVPASRDPEGKSRADLVIDCICGATLNAFVPFEKFQLIE